MNERIEKLAEDCFEYFEPNCLGETMEFNYKKFAELIVRECMEQIDDGNSDHAGGNREAIDRIKEHFGVKE